MIRLQCRIQETWVLSLGRENPLEEEIATHSSSFAWKIPKMEEPGRLQSMRLQRVGHDWVTNTHTHIHTMKYYLALKRKKVLGLS